MADSRDDPRIFLLNPDLRGILPLDGFHVPRRLRRTIRQDTFEVRVDTAFEDVVEACAEPAPDREDTWINERIVDLYQNLHARGDAHSVETWRDGELVGGLYGVRLGGAFFGESMFTRERDASKVALAHLVARLIAGGFVLLDTQFITEHLRQFGAVEISREQYQALLASARTTEADFYSLGSSSPDAAASGFSVSGETVSGILQSKAQTS
jgi:leucyl/phenylalanyl-tRNA--protein transferase